MREGRHRRGTRRRAAKDLAESAVAYEVALRLGQALWYVGTYPLRLLARALGPL